MPQVKPSIYVCCAIIGNWARESHCNPGLWESLTPGTGGFGLGQWTGERRVAMFEWLDQHGFDRDNGNAQVLYFYEEQDWQAVSSRPLKFKTLAEFLTSTSTDIAALTETFMNAWERPGVPALSERIQWANEAYEFIYEHQHDIYHWIVGNRYLSHDEILNNAWCVWYALTNGGVVPPPGERGWLYGAAREIYRRILIHR